MGIVAKSIPTKVHPDQSQVPSKVDPEQRSPFMCYPITCHACGKITYDGCGMHVEEVMANVPVEQQCTCGGAPAGSDAAADQLWR